MTETIELGELSIRLAKKDIKNVHLSVHPPDGRVTMTAPRATRLDVARAYAISRLGWIRQQQEKLKGQARDWLGRLGLAPVAYIVYRTLFQGTYELLLVKEK